MSSAERRFRLVYIDDNAGDIELLREALAEADAPVELVTFSDAASALAAMAAMPRPDLVVSDLHMPHLSGMDLVDFMRRGDLAMVPIVLVSGANEEQAVTAFGPRIGTVRLLQKGSTWQSYRTLAATLLADLRTSRPG